MGKGKKPQPVQEGQPMQCKAGGCKKAPSRFNFCASHYEWFSFGLINKAGEHVPDFDKKQEHFHAYLERTGRKAA